MTETWLDSNILDNEILPKGYIIYRRDRCTRGGGVLIAFEGSVSSQLIDCPTELKLLLIQIGIKHPTRICLVYNPPNSCVEYKQSLIAYLDNLASNPSPLIVMGGLNVPDIYWNMLSGSTTLSNQLCDLVFQYDLSQIVDCPTHIYVAGNVLDLIFTNCDSVINSLAIHSSIVHPVTSDHYLISLTLSYYQSFSKCKTPTYVYDYSKGDYEGLCQFFINSDLTNLYNCSDVNQVWTLVRDLVTTGMDQFIPKVRLKFNQYPKWFSPQMRHQVKCMRTLRKKLRKHFTLSSLQRHSF